MTRAAAEANDLATSANDPKPADLNPRLPPGCGVAPGGVTPAGKIRASRARIIGRS
jgi:hypothetical protein